MKFIGRQFEVLISIVFLCISQSIFWPPASYFSKTTQAFDASDPVNAAMQAVLLGFLAIICVARGRQMLAAVSASWLIVLLVALAFLSAFWAPAPELVLRRSATLAITTLFAMYLAVRFDMGQLVAILVKINAFAIVASLVLLAVAPHLASGASMEYPNAIRGAYGSKNALGAVSAMGILVAAWAWRCRYGSRLIAAAIIPANLALLLVSQSATAIGITLAGAYAALVVAAFRRRDAVGFVTGFSLLLGGLTAIGLVAIAWTDILAALGRNATMTGRTPIWRLSLGFIEHRPWLGYGYGDFWRHDSPQAQTYWTLLQWKVPHAHNAWLEIGLALGGVGMAGITLLWLAAFGRVARLLAAPSARHVVFCAAVLVGILVENLTEYEFLRPDSFFWVFFVVAYAHLGLAAAAYRQPAAAAWSARRRPLAVRHLPAQ